MKNKKFFLSKYFFIMKNKEIDEGKIKKSNDMEIQRVMGNVSRGR